jgi:hypothetical protein
VHIAHQRADYLMHCSALACVRAAAAAHLNIHTLVVTAARSSVQCSGPVHSYSVWQHCCVSASRVVQVQRACVQMRSSTGSCAHAAWVWLVYSSRGLLVYAGALSSPMHDHSQLHIAAVSFSSSDGSFMLVVLCARRFNRLYQIACKLHSLRSE